MLRDQWTETPSTGPSLLLDLFFLLPLPYFPLVVLRDSERIHLPSVICRFHAASRPVKVTGLCSFQLRMITGVCRVLVEVVIPIPLYDHGI